MYNIILCDKCNLCCSYCFAGTPNFGINDNGSTLSDVFMKDEFYAIILNFLHKSKISRVSLMGGEPTLHHGFKQMVLQALDKGFEVSIKSNATWCNDIADFFDQLSDVKMHYLLNVNNPISLGGNLWSLVCKNVSRLHGRQFDLQLNIDKPEFDYESVINLACESGCQRIAWNLVAPPSVGASNCDPCIDPRFVREVYSSRIVDFVIAANQCGIVTLGVHGVTPCMFTEKDFITLKKNNGKLNCKCRPVFDIYPDLSVQYCFPMQNFLGSAKLSNYQNIQEIGFSFMSKLIFLRSITYPLEDCLKCKYLTADSCDGGCLARRLKFKPDNFEEDFFERTVVTSNNFIIDSKNNSSHSGVKYVLHSKLSNEDLDLDEELWKILNYLKIQKRLLDLYENIVDIESDNSQTREAFQKLIISLLSRGILTLRPDSFLLT